MALVENIKNWFFDIQPINIRSIPPINCYNIKKYDLKAEQQVDNQKK